MDKGQERDRKRIHRKERNSKKHEKGNKRIMEK